MRLPSTSEASAEPQPCTPFADAEVQCAVNVPAKTPALAEGGSCICDYYSIADNASEATRTAPALRPKRCRVNGRVSQTDNSFTIPDVNDKRMQTARADVISSSAQTSQNVESVVEVDNSAKDIPGCSGDAAMFDSHTATNDIECEAPTEYSLIEDSANSCHDIGDDSDCGSSRAHSVNSSRARGVECVEEDAESKASTDFEPDLPINAESWSNRSGNMPGINFPGYTRNFQIGSSPEH